jgi:hypothetical protein
MERILITLVLLVISVVGFAHFGAEYLRQEFGVATPSYPTVKKTIWLDQGWSPEQRAPGIIT